MKVRFLFLLLFHFTLIGKAQSAADSYQEGVEHLHNSNYGDALSKFIAASEGFKNEDNKAGYARAALHIAKIKIGNKKFSAASQALDGLIRYCRTNQMANDSIWVEILNAKALNLKFSGRFEEALAVNNGLLHDKNVFPRYADRIYHLRSRIEMDLGDYDEAIASAKKALRGYVHKKDSLNQAAVYNIIGVGLYFEDKLDSTLIYYNRSLELKKRLNADSSDLAISTFNIGIVYEALAEYAKAISYYKEAEKFDLQDGDETVGVLSDIYVAMVNSYYSIGDYGNAEIYAKKALRLAEKIYGEDSTYSSFVYVSYANLLELKDQKRDAIGYIKKALNIRKNTYGPEHRWTFESYFDLGINYLQLHELDSAEANLRDALRIAKKINSEVSLCYAKKGLGELLSVRGEYLSAQKYYLEAETLSNRAYGENHDLSLEIRYLLAESYFANGDCERTENIIKWFKEQYEKEANALIEFFVPEILDLENRVYAIRMKHSGHIGHKQKITDNILEQINIIRKIRNRYSSNDSKIFTGKSYGTVISNAMDMVYGLYTGFEEDVHLETAFKLSELNRNNLLLEGIQKTRFQKIAGIPDNILNKENNLIQDLELVKREIHFAENSAHPEPERIDSLLSLQLNLNREREVYLGGLSQTYPEYFGLKYARAPISLARLQEDILRSDQTFLEYYVGDRNSYLFMVEKNIRRMLRLGASDTLMANTLALRKGIIERKDVSEVSRSVFERLLGGLTMQKNLIIVTDNFLNDIPFELLRNGKRQLIEDHSISYSGSADLLGLKKQELTMDADRLPWCGFAPEFESSNELLFAQQEIVKIAELMEGSFFSGESATLKNFKKMAARSSILHLASHTTMDNLNPNYNTLLFAKDSLENAITTSEIYALSLPAKLAVLSACNTGYGTFEKGEGTMNMARAFKYAGVESTVMSLWKVPDKQTADIMVSFYDFLKKGLPKNEALQQAKLTYLDSVDDDLLRQPYYWAGFVLSGNTDPIPGPTSKWWWLLVVPVAITILIYRSGKGQFR